MHDFYQIVKKAEARTIQRSILDKGQLHWDRALIQV